jgi:transposase-like protein
MSDSNTSTAKVSPSRIIGRNGVYYKSQNPNRYARKQNRASLDKIILKRRDPELFERVHQDYLTGEYNSASLAEKHGLNHSAVYAYIRFNKWSRELRSLGITPQLEPPPNRIQPDIKLLQAIEQDYANDISQEKIAIKYCIYPTTVSRLVKKYGWLNSVKRRQLQDEHRRPITKAELLRRKVDRMDHVTFKFINDCFGQFEILLQSVESYKGDGKKLDTKTLKELVNDFGHLYKTLRAIKSDLRKGMPVTRNEKIKPGNPVIFPIGKDGEEIIPSPATQKAPVRMMSEVRSLA